MAHPKRRQSKTRTLKRRTHDKAVAPMYTTLFALLAVTIVVRWLSLRKLLNNHNG